MLTATTSDHRPLWRALALSIVLHAAFLVISRSPPVLSTDPNLAVDLRLWIDAPGEQAAEHETEANVLRAATAAAVSTASAATTAAADSFVAPAAAMAEDASMPAERAALSELPPLSSESTELPPQPDTAVLTTATASDLVAVEQVETQPAPPAPKAVTAPESDLLAKRVKDWSADFLDERKLSTQKVWRKNGQEYVAHLTRLPATDDMQMDRVEVLITTQRDGKALATRMQMKRLAFSHFTKLVDFWDPRMQLHDDEFHGRFHSNSEIQLGWDSKIAPRFLGQVTTSAGKYEVSADSKRRSRREIFPQGIDLFAPVISMARPVVPGAGQSLPPDARRRQFTRESHIVFYADGSYGWRAESGSSEQREPVGSQRLYLIAGPGARLHVRGKVIGRVLVYSPEDIFVSGDLTYVNDVRRAADSADYIGLVSDKNVTIAGPEVTGPGDLRVEAAIYARRRFAIEDIGGSRGATLAIFGSVSAGTLSASEPRFAMKFEFDPRFERARPPGFPMTNRYELEDWDKLWSPL